MKAADIKEGDRLYWQRRRYGSGVEVQVIDPRPVFGKTSSWARTVTEGHGTGVLCTVITEAPDNRYAVPLRQLLGPYRETKRRIEAEYRAAEAAQRETDRRRKQERDRAEALTRKARRIGVTAYTRSGFGGTTTTITVDVEAFAAMVEELAKHGWKAPVS